MTERKGELASLLVSLWLGLFLFGFLAGSVRLWDTTGILLSPAFRYTILGVLPVLVCGLVLIRFRISHLSLNPSGFGLAYFAVLLTDWICRSHNMLQGPSIRGTVLAGALFSFPFLRKKLGSFFPLFLVAASLGSVAVFHLAAGGRLLFSDDHSPVFYRIELLKENFPFIPFYNPLWNAGTDARDFFATGILNVYFAFLPIIHAFPLESVYNLIVTLTAFVVLPFCVYYASHLEGHSRTAASIAGLLAFASNLLFHRWALKYGAMGFVFSTCLAPLGLSLAGRVVDLDRQLSLTRTIVTLIIISLILCWPLMGMFFLPVLALGLIRSRRLIWKKNVVLLLILLVCLNVPWMVLFVKVSKVFSFLNLESVAVENRDSGFEGTNSEAKSPEEHKPKAYTKHRVKHKREPITVPSLVKTTRQHAVNFNPLLLFLVIPGLVLIPNRTTRILLYVQSLWLIFLATFVASLKPQLELDRAFIILALLWTLPTALAIEQIMIKSKNLFLPCLLSGSLLASVYSVFFVIYNRTPERYFFAGSDVLDITNAIQKYAGKGRVFFSGFVLHELSGGHLAPLAYFTKRPLYASSPVHNYWHYKDATPESYLKRGIPGIEEYLDLLNATAVITYEPTWLAVFSSDTNRYRKAWQGRRFTLFERNIPNPTYFLEGKGEILSQSTSEVRLRLESETAVIKFNYFSFLEAPGCTVSPERISEDVTFVRLSDCSSKDEVVLRGKTGFWRLFYD